MKEKADGGCYCPRDGNNPCQSFDTSDGGEWCAQIAVTIDVLIAMTTHTFANDHHILCFTLGM
jgi:hypothetical protein